MTALLTRPVPAQAWQAAAGGATGTDLPRTTAAGPPVDSAVAGIDADRWQKIIVEIVAMQQLDNDWDGPGALAPSRELLDSALGLAHLLKAAGTKAPSVALAATDGSVNFVWHGPDGLYCEIEIDRPLHADVMLLEPAKAPRHWELPNG
jgi:hypothetical protein